MGRIPTAEDLWGEQCRAYMTANAPDCAHCGAHTLVAEGMPERHVVYSEPGTDDFVTWVLEVYRCEACKERTVNRVELDRVTREEQDRENDRAVARAGMRRHAPPLLALFNPKAWDREVLREYPRREEPDLMKRWQERR